MSLLPCPFCGALSSAEVVAGGSDDDRYYRVECRACYGSGPPAYGFDAIDLIAIEKWNTRPQGD